MAGEIQLNSTSFASESGGTITINNATVGSAVAMSANQACVKTALNASGSAPIYACRAWINFDGTSASIGTGRANGNVSGVTDNGTGQYTITWATAMADANYCTVISGTRGGATAEVTQQIDPATYSSSSCKIGNTNTAGSPADGSIMTLAVFR